MHELHCLCDNKNKIKLTILKSLVPNPFPTKPLFFLYADCVAAFPRSQHSPLPHLKLFHTPLHLPPLLLLLTCTKVMGNHHIIDI